MAPLWPLCVGLLVIHGTRAFAPSFAGRRPPLAARLSANAAGVPPPPLDDAEIDAFLSDLRSAKDVEGALRASFDKIDAGVSVELKRRAAQEAGAEWRAMAALVQDVAEERMADAKDRLEALLGAGELRALDTALTRLVGAGLADAAFLLVLNANVDASARAAAAAPDDEGEAQRAGVLRHVHTRVQVRPLLLLLLRYSYCSYAAAVAATAPPATGYCSRQRCLLLLTH